MKDMRRWILTRSLRRPVVAWNGPVRGPPGTPRGKAHPDAQARPLVVRAPSDRRCGVDRGVRRDVRDLTRRRHRLLEQLHAPEHGVDPGPRPAARRGAAGIGRHRADRDRHDGRHEGDRSGGPAAGRGDARGGGEAPARRRRPVAVREGRRRPDEPGRDGGLRDGGVRSAGAGPLDRPREGVRGHRRGGVGPRPGGRGLRAARPGGEPAVGRRHGPRDPHGGDRAVHRVRVALRDGDAAGLRARRARDRDVGDRPGQQRDEDARVLDRARPADRARRGRGLRVVHRLAPPAEPPGGTRRRRLGRARDRHVGARRPVRGHDRVRRAPRDVRVGDQLPLRPGGRREHRRALHDDRGAHVPARDARVHRPAGPLAPAAAGAGGGRAPRRPARASGRGGRGPSNGARSSTAPRPS